MVFPFSPPKTHVMVVSTLRMGEDVTDEPNSAPARPNSNWITKKKGALVILLMAVLTIVV